MNVNKMVGDNSIPFSERLFHLETKKSELQSQITNDKKLTFDIYHKFTENLDDIATPNNKGKEIVLAIEVLKETKRGFRKYNIDLKKKISGKYFIDYFKDYINVSSFNLCSIGINFYHRSEYTLKTMISGANKICKLGVISNEKFNKFMERLEEESNGKQ